MGDTKLTAILRAHRYLASRYKI